MRKEKVKKKHVKRAVQNILRLAGYLSALSCSSLATGHPFPRSPIKCLQYEYFHINSETLNRQQGLISEGGERRRKRRDKRKRNERG
jgi:hypothetical protein